MAILDPNRAVEAKFISYTAVTTTGLTHTGLLAVETDSGVTLLAADGKEIALVRSDLEALVGIDKSLMRRDEDLRPQDLADLFALIAGRRCARKTFARNRPEVVRPEALRGEFYLLPEQAEIYGSTLVLEDRYNNLGFWRAETITPPGRSTSPSRDYSRRRSSTPAPDDAASLGHLSRPEQEERARDRHRQLGCLSFADGRPGRASKPASTAWRCDRPGKLRGPLFDLKSVRLRPIAK